MAIGKVLIIDDDISFSETLELCLLELNLTVIKANNGITGFDLFDQENPDLVITDLKMPGYSGLDIVKKVKEVDKSIPVVVITAYDDMETTIKAIQLGAYDYLEKSLEFSRLKTVITRALESKKLSERLENTIQEDSKHFQIRNSLIGKTPRIKEIIKKIGMLSSNRVNVLIQGESGTGKELISRIIHYSGVTKDHPFIAVNCTALSETLLESELFGHVKGSFTGAIKDKKGKFELAEEGTIFLDEISEISPLLQIKLLRVLQEKEYERVGDEISLPIKARIIAASNKNLKELVEQDKFREDLYYRLNVFTIDLPPLRERKEDIPALTMFFLKKINKEIHKNVWKIPYEVMELLQQHDWEGNVRQLENTLMQAVVLAKGDVLEKEYLMLSASSNNNNKMERVNLSLADVEKEHIKLILDACDWDKQAASKKLGIAKTTLYNKIEQYNIK